MTRIRSALTRRLSRLGVRITAFLRAPAALGLVGTVALVVVLLPLRWLGALQQIELATYDRMVGIRGAGPGEQTRVVQIIATETDIERFGWPLSDGIIAEAITRLHDAEVRAIGLDIFRPTPIGPGSDRLDTVLRATPELVWADRFNEGTWAGIAAPAAAMDRSGFSDLLLDDGGVARRALLYLDDGKRVAQAISLRLAIAYLRPEGLAPKADPNGFLQLGGVSLPPLDANFGGYRSVDARGYQILRELLAPQRLATFSLSDLMDTKVPAAAIRGRIAIVGVVADSVKDYVVAPISVSGPRTLAGVTLHGLFTAQLLAHAIDGVPATHAPSRRAELALLLAVLVAGGLTGTFVPRLGWLIAVTFGGGAALLAGAYVAFLHAIWLPVLLLPGGWILAVVVSKVATAQVEHSQRIVLMRLFSTHISAPIAQEMWRRRHDFVRLGRPVPVRLNATVLFSDINDFTTSTEDMEPEHIVRWLEPYMNVMTKLIDDHGGVVERFSGDGVLAMFGVPVPRETDDEIAADATAAVECARRMAGAQLALNQAYRAANQPEIRFAVGIQSGALVGCSLGNAERLQYTTMGDATNTAARLVTVAKDLMKQPGMIEACRIVIGGQTRTLVGDQFALRPLGFVELKGKHHRTECFAIEDLV